VLVELPEPPAVVIQVLLILRVDGVDLRGARKGRVERRMGCRFGVRAASDPVERSASRALPLFARKEKIHLKADVPPGRCSLG